MKITVSQYAGFCGGVKRAYEMISSLDMEKIKKPVYILGSLVHNDEVNKKIEKKGIAKIDRDIFLKSKKGKIGTIIITAHGDGPDVYKIAKSKKMDIIDTTCPKVIKVQRLARIFSKRGYKLILIGDKNHKEVKGINEWGGGKASIVSDKKDLKNIKLRKDEKIAVLSQTTQDESFFKYAAETIKKKFPQAEIIYTICRTTSQRQEEVKKLARENKAVIVIGSPASANSQRLFEISKKINLKTYFVENASGINKKWFGKADTLAITAGASTPVWVIKKVIKQLNGV